MTDKVIPISRHKDYIPSKVEAKLYYEMDPNLDDAAKDLYTYLLTVNKQFHSLNYCEWNTMENAIIAVSSSEWARAMPTYAVRNAFTTLRKNRYIRHTYNEFLEARILELNEFVGENAR